MAATDVFLLAYAAAAVLVMVIGISYKVSQTLWNRAVMKREMNKRNASFYPAKKMPFMQAFWSVNVAPFTRFWMRANPVTFAGHVLYHTGLFIALGIYALVAVLSIDKITGMAPQEAMPLLFDWFAHKDTIFGTTGVMGAVGGFMVPLFVFALVIGVIGMATPFVMSALGKRGMIRPVDAVTRAAKIRTDGLPRSSALGYQRKLIGMVVLVMDSAMLSTFVAPVSFEYAYFIHVTFALTIMAVFPFSFLFHEVARWRMWTGVRRAVDRRTA